MTEESSLVAAVRRQNVEMVALVESATDEEFGLACVDHGGNTVGEIAAHSAEGYEQTAAWLRRITARVAVPAAPPAAEHAHDHEHPHPHPHEHEAAGVDRAATATRLQVSGEAVLAEIGSLTEEDLRIVPPASPFADGTSTLDGALRGLSAHLQEHLESMRRAIAAARPS